MLDTAYVVRGLYGWAREQLPDTSECGIPAGAAGLQARGKCDKSSFSIAPRLFKIKKLIGFFQLQNCCWSMGTLTCPSVAISHGFENGNMTNLPEVVPG